MSRLISLAAVIVLAALAVTGCSTRGSLSVGNAYIAVPTSGVTAAYLEIRNNGASNELLSVTTSAGGTVALRAPVTDGAQVMAMRDVPAIPIPADSTVHLSPNGYHLLITGATGLDGGKAITLRLTFAHGGTLSVLALVTNPESGGSSYFLN